MMGTCTCTMTKAYNWDVNRLIKLSAKLTPFDRPVDSFSEWAHWIWEPDITLDGFVEHLQRVLDADLTKPIILTATGWLMDGAHRLVKARLEGVDRVKVVQFEIDPEPDRIGFRGPARTCTSTSR